jgi:hypothetical protein
MTTHDAAFVTAISGARTADAAWEALARLADETVGTKLFTASMFDIPAGLVRRVYSNQPEAYPTSGTKPLRVNAGDWFDIVFHQHRIFVANDKAELAKTFPDHELIFSLGCGAIINMPIVLWGELVATINLLDVEGSYAAERVAEAEERLAVPARLCSAIALRLSPLSGVAA